jgi:IS30 family transposase
VHKLHKEKKMNSMEIELRRKQVSALLAQAVTEEEIAQKLNVDQSTISRDIKHLKVIRGLFMTWLNQI